MLAYTHTYIAVLSLSHLPAMTLSRSFATSLCSPTFYLPLTRNRLFYFCPVNNGRRLAYQALGFSHFLSFPPFDCLSLFPSPVLLFCSFNYMSSFVYLKSCLFSSLSLVHPLVFNYIYSTFAW